MAVYILGIYSGHNASAVLLKDGRIVAAVNEERYRRKKNYRGFPEEGIRYVLKEAEIKRKDVDYIALPYNLSVPFHSPEGAKKSFVGLLAKTQPVVSWLRGIYGHLAYKIPFFRRLIDMFHPLIWGVIGGINVRQERLFLRDYFGIPLENILNYDHHMAHAASAYYSSPLNQKRSLVFTLDAEGDLTSASVNVFEKDKIKRLATTFHTNSLGWVYHQLTGFMGMTPGEHEYKIMGLAPYARKEHVDKVYQEIEDLITLDPTNPLRFKSKIDARKTDLYLKERVAHFRFDNVAGAFQRLVEERVVEWIKGGMTKTKIKNICCAGGVFMNVKANQRITELPGVKQVFFTPSSGDESSTIGAAFLAYLDYCRKSHQPVDFKAMKIDSLYWGPSFSKSQIEFFIKKRKLRKKYKVEKYQNIEKKIAQLLAEGKIVANMAGRMEWGARALGNRSILADPSEDKVIRVLNEQIKGRDFWMPFTPSVLAERASKYLKLTKNVDPYYMIVTFNSTKKGQKDLEAAMHPYDFTIRPQLVRRDGNPRYYKIIREFEKLTGIGGVLNTSFNLHGYPIVLGPREAMWVFESSGLEYLALENYLISKKSKK